MNRRNSTKRTAPFALLGAAVAACLAGCGGTAVTTEQIVPTPDTTVQIFGVQPASGLQASGLASADATTGYLTGAVASTVVAIPAQAVDGTIPLGFAPGGQYVNSSFGQAVAPGASVIFGASLANGTNGATGEVVPVNPAGVVLTSPEVPGFSQPLTFNLNTGGPLVNAQYRTAPFPLPFATTGLHRLVVSATDARPRTATTTFDVVVVAPTDSAVVAQIVRAGATATAAPIPVPGATATITNPITGARAQTTSDDQGVVVLFAAPGQQTITVTSVAGATTRRGTAAVTLVAGQALVSSTSGTSTAPFQITVQ